MASYFVPTRFMWRFGGRQVHLCGSFTRWVETVPMTPVEGNPAVFAVVVHLPPGYHQYKFIVDGKWRHDETAPFMPDPLGNVNNWLFVRRIDPGTSAAPFDQQQLIAAQQQSAVVAAQQQLSAQAQSNPSHPALNTFAQAPSSNAIPQLTSPVQGDVDMANAESVAAPIVILNPKEPEYTKKKIADFLHNHTAYELIPESGKVVVLDMDLPVRQAFHALLEQEIASAPLWDCETCTITGVISASDFIAILKRLRNNVSASGNTMTEADMDAYTIRGLRDEGASEGREPKALVYVRPDDMLSKVVSTLAREKCSLAPVLSCDPGGQELPNVLHMASLSAVLACLMRHFRASLASLPLLAQPLGSLPLGTWSPDAGVAHQDVLPDGKEHRQWRKLQPLHTVMVNTPLTQALGLLLEAGVSALPVVDEKRCLLDVYARSDITALAHGNAYSRLQWEDVTVGQALSLTTIQSAGPSPSQLHPSTSQPWSPPKQGGSSLSLNQHPAMGGLSAELQAQQHRQQAAATLQAAGSTGGLADGWYGGGGGTSPAVRRGRVHVCTKDDSLRTVVERLAIPGVRRLIVVQPETRRVNAVISLSDVANFLFRNPME